MTSGTVEVRAERVRRELTALVVDGSDVSEIHRRAIDLVGASVRSELTCWALIDPETLAIGSMTSGCDRIPSSYEAILAESEYGGNDFGTFAGIARSGDIVLRVSDLPRRAIGRSLRYSSVWQPLGLNREMRVVFVVNGFCWGGAGFVRSGPEFGDGDAELLRVLSPILASVTRTAMRGSAAAHLDDEGPAVVVTDGDGNPLALTDAARAWQNRLGADAPGRLEVLLRAAAAGARSSPTGAFRTLVRDAGGGWTLVRSTGLFGEDPPRTAVTLEAARGEEITRLLFAAYAFTPRERQVCRDVLAGHSTTDIAHRLQITANTVQDHIRSIYAKSGVRSRAELAARLRSE
ncbi:LuxR C-terminal-related transcriptional regulator [Rhodococcus sp. NPDC003318]|uniref:helix-turn-helix transcriptional regulator n=1 Tax=Rhodococcus sp. NPDC003318 TaxID=3364503 RepID=UPI0036914B72